MGLGAGGVNWTPFWVWLKASQAGAAAAPAAGLGVVKEAQSPAAGKLLPCKHKVMCHGNHVT